MRAMFVRADHLTIEEMQSADERQALADEARLRASRAAQIDDDEDEAVPAGAIDGEEFDDED